MLNSLGAGVQSAVGVAEEAAGDDVLALQVVGGVGRGGVVSWYGMGGMEHECADESILKEAGSKQSRCLLMEERPTWEMEEE